MRLRPWLYACAIVGSLSISTTAAWAQSEVKTLGRYGDWAGYAYTENGKPVCYAASAPVKSRGKIGTAPRETYFMVTHRPEYGDIGIVTVVAGYSFKEGSHTTIKIGSASYRFFTRDQTAWANGGEDKSVVRAMKRGNTMLVTGRSQSGTLTTDLYSLIGFSKAYTTISKACGVKAK